MMGFIKYTCPSKERIMKTVRNNRTNEWRKARKIENSTRGENGQRKHSTVDLREKILQMKYDELSLEAERLRVVIQNVCIRVKYGKPEIDTSFVFIDKRSLEIISALNAEI